MILLGEIGRIVTTLWIIPTLKISRNRLDKEGHSIPVQDRQDQHFQSVGRAGRRLDRQP